MHNIDLAYIHRLDDDAQQCAVTGVAPVDDRKLIDTVE
jgi:hypothetical protein